MKEEARKIIKKLLIEQDINYVQLAQLMKEKGYQETPDTIRSKIHRGSFSFSFVLEICDALNLMIKFEK